MPQCGFAAHPSDQPRSMELCEHLKSFPCIGLTFFLFTIFILFYILKRYVKKIIIIKLKKFHDVIFRNNMRRGYSVYSFME